MRKTIGILAEQAKPGNCLIYGLFDPGCGTLRYVGRTRMRLYERFRAHVRYAKVSIRNNHFLNWLRQVIQEGGLPLVDILDEVPLEDGKKEEYAWIQEFLAYGQPLTNSVIAEADDPYYALSVTEETRRRMSESHKRTRYDFHVRSERMKQLWQDEEYREKVTTGLKRAYEETDYREKVSKGGRGLKRSQETRARISAAKIKQYSDPEERNKQSARLLAPDTNAKIRKARAWTPERRQHCSEYMKHKWEDPEYRDKQSVLIRDGRRKQKKGDE